VTAAGVGIAIAAAFSLLAFQRGYRQSLWRELERLGAHVLVVPKGCPYDAASLALHGANWPCHLKASYLAEVRSLPGVAVAAPVFMSAFFDPTGQHVVYVGIDTNMLALKPGWKIQGAFPRAGEILLGAEAARRFGWQVGYRPTLPGLNGAQGSVSGILAATQSAEDTFISQPLADAQRLFGRSNELTHVLVRLTDPNRLDKVVAALRGCDAGMHINVIPLAHLFHTIQSLVNSTRWFLASATLVALLAAGAGVSAALLIAITERTREIGILRALGASRADVFRLFWIETTQTCLAGATAGIFLAFLLLNTVEKWLRNRLPFTPDGAFMIWDWQTAGLCLAIAVALGSMAAFLPAWRAAQLPPMQAIREKSCRT
jgi:putative ABC transport system permease protein